MLQKGNSFFVFNPEKYPKSDLEEKIYADTSGYVSSIDNFQIGMAALELGAGRRTKSDRIDPKAGIIFHKKIGDRIKKGEIIAEIFSDKADKIDAAKLRFKDAIVYSRTKVNKPKLIKKILF
jgi:thymidine phosphorylase